MKILITTDAYDSMINGVAVSVNNLSDALRNAGNEVRILTLSQTHQSYRNGDVYYIRSFPLKIYPDARATFALNDSFVDELIEWQPDVIHSQCEFFTFLFACKIAKHTNVPVIHTYHTLYECYTHYFCPSERLGRKFVAAVTRFVCNHTDAVIAPTKKTADILEGYEVDAPIYIIPTGLNLEHLQLPSYNASAASLRAKLEIPNNVPVLITLGRVAREKNLDFVLTQMATPAMRNSKAHLVIVGDGPDRERLEAMVHNLQLQDTVHFTGMVKPDEVGKYYRIGDIFVSASQSETQGLTYIEAMACGLPLLCRKDSCLDSVLIPGNNGYFFETEEEFAESFARLTCSKEHLQALSTRAYQSSKLFSKETFAERALFLYKNTITEKEHPKKHFHFPYFPKMHWEKIYGILNR